MPEKKVAVAYKRFSEIASVTFHPEVGRARLVDVLDTDCLIKDARIIEGFTSPYADSSTFALILLESASGEQFTTICGGQVVVNKIRKALDDSLLPLYGKFQKVDSKGGFWYYDIL